jgi:hypothetical protein
MLLRVYYQIRPFIPRSAQIYLRRWLFRWRLRRHRETWPIHEPSNKLPEGWKGWPDGKRFAVVLTHDVETTRGVERCERLMRLNQDAGFRASFNFVPERYPVPVSVREMLASNGFEVGVHDLKHDGKLYSSKDHFERSAIAINRYMKEWGAVGFRSGAMHHNLEWLLSLDIAYDASTFEYDPFEPQSGGEWTIFPFRVTSADGTRSYVELPYTLPQDFALFVMLTEKTIDIWKRKLDWVVERGGMVLLITHPDYMEFVRQDRGVDSYPSDRYRELLEYIRTRYAGEYWNPLPREIAEFVTTGSFA